VNKKTKAAISQLEYLKKLAPKELQLAAEWKKKWKILISTILSSQTKDETTIKYSKILYKKFSTPRKLANAELSQIKKIIRPINFYKTKAKHIKETAEIISKAGIPKTVDKLLELPGVGRKVANVYLAEAYNMPCIGVDVHVARISRKLKWTKNKHPLKIEKDLENLFPKKYWNSINYILVRFGRTFGRSRRQEDKILKRIRAIK